MGKWVVPGLVVALVTLQLWMPTLPLALPTDGKIVAGQATIQHTTPNSLSIQQATDKAILNWNSFSIAANEAVHFIQPSVSSIALNRVIGVDPSVILGQLQANGRIFLINPNGILFGAGAQINVGGLLATTLQTRDDDFMAGRYLFAQDPLKGLKTVINRGTIHVSDNGYVVLMAPGVSNEGVILANLGTALLGSGQKFTLDLMGDGLIRYAINDKVLGQVTGPDGKPLTSAVGNSGTIQADGGQVILSARASGDVFSSVVNQSGVIRARSLVNRDGLVRLEGGDTGLVQVVGTLDASGAGTGERGGKVSVLGQSVNLLESARIDVSGHSGGGTVLIGGNYQGQGPELNATSTQVAAGSMIKADALANGDGGKVIVLADGHTAYAGQISAKGGQAGGNGGFVEVSGKNTLDFTGRVDTSASAGHTGTLLLDPSDITISTAANANISAGPTFTGTALTSTLNVTTLQTALGTNNVIVDTTSPFASAGNITVSNAVTWASANSLDLRAHNDITVNAGISSTGLGVLRLIANQDGIGGGNIALNAAISARLGGVQLSGTGVTSVAVGTITTTGTALGNQDAGNVTINATGAVNLAGAITATGGTASAGNPGRAGGTVNISGVGVTTGTVTANGSVGNGAGQLGGNGGTIQVTSTNGVTTGNLAASGGNAGTGTANGGTGGTISVTNSGAGNVSLGTVTARTGNAIGTGSSAAGSVSATNSAAGAFVQTGAINTVGGSNGTGGAVTLSSQGALQFAAASTIQTTGGTALAGTVGRTGGAVTLSGTTITTTGAITTSGSAGNGADQAGGHAGNITVTSNGTLNTSAGTLTASGGNAGGGDAAGGNGGVISLTNNSATTGDVTTGALTARTGNAAGIGAAGAAGSVTVTQNNATGGAVVQTAAINTSGGTKGAGGAVILNSASNVNVTSTITTTGGAAVVGGTHAGTGGGNVTITGVDRTVTGLITASGGAAVGTDQAGGNAGIVSSTGTGTLTTTGGVTTRTGAATGIGAGGVAGSITLAGTTVSSGALTTTGGANGNGGNISLTSTTGATTLTGAITTSGGTANAGTSGRQAGAVTVTSAGSVTTTTLTATGSNGNGADQAGGTGGIVSATSTGGNVTVGAISGTGGNGVTGNAAGGNGGTVTLDASGATPTITHANITTTGGNRSGSGTAGAGGAISVADAALLAANTVVTASGGSAGLGIGGNVTFSDTLDSLGANRTLAVNTNGTTTFSGNVGGTLALTSLTTDLPGSVSLRNVTTTGAQTYNENTLTLNGTYTTTNSAVTAGTVGAAITLGGDTTVSTGSGNITFNGIVNGTQSLTANSTGITLFAGAVGNSTALTSLTTDAGGTTRINGGSVATSGNQTYNDNITMNQATTLTATGGAITFGGNATNSAAGGDITVDAPTINLTGGTSVATTGNGPISFFTDALNPNGASINAGTGAFSLAPNVLARTIEFGDVNTGRVTDVYYGSNFGSVTAGSFTIGRPTHTGNIYVTGVAAAPSAMTFVNGGAGSVTFENASYVSGNQNLGVVSGSGGIDLGTNLTLGAGTFRLTTTGAIAQTAGTLTADTAGFSAATGIDLSQPTNNVTTWAAQTTMGNLTLTDTNGFAISSVLTTGLHPAITGLTATTGTIALQSGGAVTQTARILGSALSLLGSGPYTLANGANDVSTLAANSTGSIQYTDANALTVGTVGATSGITSGNSNVALFAGGPLTVSQAINTGAGNLDFTAGGAVTQTAALTVGGATTLAATVAGSDILLGTQANNLGGAVAFGGTPTNIRDVGLRNVSAGATVPTLAGLTNLRNLTLTFDNAPMVLSSLTASGNLTATASGLISQSGALSVAGNAGFNTTAAATLGSVTLATGSALALGTSTVGGNLTVTTAAGDITLPLGQTLTVAGDAILTPAGNVNLLGTTQIGGTQSLNGGIGSTFVLAADTNLNALALPAAGNITVNLTGTKATFAGAPLLPAAVTLANAGNTFGGTVSVTTASPAFTGTMTNTHNLTQSAAVTLNPGQGLTATDLGGTAGTRGNITLPNAGNSFNTVTFTGGDIAWQQANAVAIGSVSANAGATSIGALTITANGPITQTGAVTAAGTTTLAAGAGNNITLTNAANDFSTVGITSGNNVTLTDATALNLAASTVSGTLNVTTTGALTQSGALTVAGATTLSAGPGNDITLNNAGNDFSTVGITSGNNVSLTDANALNLAASTVSGTLNVTTTGALTQSGPFTVAGITTLSTGAANDITLTNAGNDFSTVGVTSGNNVALTDANALDLAASTLSGALSVTTNGALTQSGALNVAGATTLAAGVNDITLNIAGNDFSTVGVTSGNNVTLTDANALTLNASNVSGNFSANAGDLTVGGPVASTGGSLNLTGANTVTQLANLTANGANNVTVTTTTGSITMAPAATTTSGTGAISYTAGTDVTLGSLSTGGGVNVFANGGSVFSAAGSGTNVSAGAASTLQAFNGVVGTQAAPINVAVNPGTLGIRATTAIGGISGFLTGTVLPGNALTLLNVPPGLVCFNICSVTSFPVSGLARSTFGYLNPDTIIPAYYPQPSRSVLISDITSVYMPGTLLQPSPVSLSSGSPAVQSMGPKAKAGASCKQGETVPNQQAAAATFDVHCTVR